MSLPDIGSIVLLVLAAHGLGLGIFLLFNKRGDLAASRFLASLIIVFSFDIGLPKLARLTYPDFPHLILSSFPLILTVGPLLYLYIRQLASASKGVTYRDLLHFLPFILAILYLAPFYLQGGAEKIEYRQMMANQGIPADIMILWGLKIVHLLVYLFAGYTLLRKYRRSLLDGFSFIEKLNLSWLRYLVLIITVIWIINLGFFFGFAADIPGVSYQPVEFATSIMLSLFIYSLGYIGLIQPEVFSLGFLKQGEPAASYSKYERSGLSAEQAEVYEKKLTGYMEEKKPYRIKDLTLGELAGRLGVPPNHLSQVINENLNQNFYDFVNGYRVEEVKRELRKGNHRDLTILGIAYDAGFNSKSSFYKAFKRRTGTTPTQFVKNQTN